MTLLETTFTDGTEIPWPDEPDDGVPRGDLVAEPTTWEPIDLGPYLSGEIVRPESSLGITRSDGLRLIYPGREHAFVGETECGKTWLSLGCVAAELAAGNHVVYIHFEESDPGSTIERLLLLGVDPDVIASGLRFVGPGRAARIEWVAALMNPAPTLVVLDGVNEGMALQGADVNGVDGASAFRRLFVTPFLRVGASTIGNDHVTKDRDGRGRYAFGSAHKVNAVDGSVILIENAEPFGRGMRGVSHVFVSKDRPGHLRALGRPTKLPGKTYLGTLVVDSSNKFEPLSMNFYAPNAEEETPTGADDPFNEDADTVYAVIAALPGHEVESIRQLRAELRKAEKGMRNTKVQDAVDDLLVTGRLVRSGRYGFKAVLSGSHDSDQSGGSEAVPGSGSPKGEGTGNRSPNPVPGTAGNRLGTAEPVDETETEEVR
jgi:hypothetical protein